MTCTCGHIMLGLERTKTIRELQVPRFTRPEPSRGRRW